MKKKLYKLSAQIKIM